jgi:hypothetical protein
MSAPDLNDLHTQSFNLHQLLAVLYEQATELQFVLSSGERDTTAERVASLLILARDEAERLDGAIGECLSARKART